RLPLGNSFLLRGGAGGHAGAVWQTVTVRDPATVPTGTPAKTTSAAFTFGPEVVLGARWLLGPTLFADASATGAMALFRQGETLRASTGLMGTLAIGARF